MSEKTWARAFTFIKHIHGHTHTHTHALVLTLNGGIPASCAIHTFPGSWVFHWSTHRYVIDLFISL